MKRTMLALATLVGGGLVLSSVTFATTKSGQVLPPIGQRVYLLDRQTPYAPTDIRREIPADGKQKILRDPVHPGHGVLKRPAVAKKAPPVDRGPRSAAGKVRLRTMVVDGHLHQPRVQFEREVLPVDRADEPVSGQFFEKVFAPLGDDNF